MPGGPTRRRRPYVVIGTAIVLVAAVLLGYVALFGWPAGVDAAQERTMRASITSYLEERHWRGVPEARHGKQEVRWICADRLVEVSRDGDNYEVGLHALCQEFTAVDGSLVEGSADLETATLTKARTAFGLPADAPVRR